MQVQKVETRHSHPYNLFCNKSPVIKQENFPPNVLPSNVPLMNVRLLTFNGPAHQGVMHREGMHKAGIEAESGRGGVIGIYRQGILIRRRLRKRFILF